MTPPIQPYKTPPLYLSWLETTLADFHFTNLGFASVFKIRKDPNARS